MFVRQFLMDAAGDGTPAGGTPAAGAPAAGTPAPAAGAPASGTQPATPWHGTLDAETQGWVTNRGLDKLDANAALPELIKTARGAEKLIGAPADQILRLPTDKSTTEEMALFHNRLGRPVDPSGYKLPVPEGADPAFAKEAANWFHEQGISAKAAEGLTAKWNEYTAVQMKAAGDKAAADLVADVDSLKKEWGAGYDNEILKAKTAAKEFGIDAATLDQMQAGMGFSKMMKFMATLGSKVGEAQFHGDGGGGNKGFQGAMTPAAAQSKINELRADKTFFAKLTAKNVEAQAEWNRLHEWASAGQ